MNRFRLAISPSELNFPATVTSGMMFRWEFNGESWKGYDGGDWYEVSIAGDQFEIRSNADESAFRRLFRLDTSTSEMVDRIVLLCPALADIRHHRNIRLLAPGDATEATIGFLCSANNTLHRIVPMVRILASYGGGQFPNFAEVAAIPEGDLQAQGFGYRARTIPRAASQILDRGGEEWLDQLKRMPYSFVHQSLMEIDGIGPKLADCIALFALHHTEAVPIDTHVWQQLQPRLRPDWNGMKMTDKKGKDLAEHLRNLCGGDAAWVQQWLFFHGLTQGPARGMVKSCS
ncbi:MAG: hypothetical protein KF812_06385 [Fimbriimonadaceae bacterium]|nr:hypothetical protein [Fimbriimonadaceae bacterium]